MIQSQPGAQPAAAGRSGAGARPGAPASRPAPGGDRSAVGRVGEVTRATLTAIDFPQFVASLIQGTFKAIVDASIQQMEAYAALLKNVAATVDRFMDDNVTEGMAKDHLANEHSWLFRRDASRGQPQLVVDRDANRELPSFLKDLGFTLAGRARHARRSTDVIVPATRRTLAETAPADAGDDGADGDQPRRRRRRRDQGQADVPHRRVGDDRAASSTSRRRRPATWPARPARGSSTRRG